MRRVLGASAPLVLFLALATLLGCTGGVPEGPVPPGVKNGRLGGIEAIGYIERSDAKDGSWVLFDAKRDSSGSVQPNVVARVRPASGQSFLDEIEGSYVWVAGRRSGRKSGGPPTIIADALEPVQER